MNETVPYTQPVENTRGTRIFKTGLPRGGRLAVTAVLAAGALVCGLLASCASAKYYGTDVAGQTVAASGNIYKDSKKLEAARNDIVYSGEGKSYKDAKAFLYSNWFEDYRDRLYGINQLRAYKWEGALRSGGQGQAVTIFYYWQSNSSSSITRIDDVTITGLPQDVYSIPPFTLDDGGYTVDSYVLEKDMPVAVTTFTVNGHPYTLQALGMEVKRMTLYAVFVMDGQTFRIVDGDGTVCAEFDDSTYRIYEEAGEDADLLWPCIAAFATVREGRRQLVLK